MNQRLNCALMWDKSSKIRDAHLPLDVLEFHVIQAGNLHPHVRGLQGGLQVLLPAQHRPGGRRCRR
jgi:hypothetical protein